LGVPDGFERWLYHQDILGKLSSNLRRLPEVCTAYHLCHFDDCFDLVGREFYQVIVEFFTVSTFCDFDSLDAISAIENINMDGNNISLCGHKRQG